MLRCDTCTTVHLFGSLILNKEFKKNNKNSKSSGFVATCSRENSFEAF